MSMNPGVAALGIGTPYDATIASAAAVAGVPVSLVKAIISVESGWNPNAVNAADPSYGLMQVNTRAHPDVTPAQMLDPVQNINYGTAYLGVQVATYGLNGGISAYNAGHPITSNQATYVADVLAYKAWFEANDAASSGAGSVINTLTSIFSPGGSGDFSVPTINGSGVMTMDSTGLDLSGFDPSTLLAGGAGLALLLILGGLLLLRS